MKGLDYKTFSDFLAEHFSGKMQKLAVNGGFTCPNRDGRAGRGGCSFCDNRTFAPAYCHKGMSISEQLEAGKAFFARKYPDMRYLAYFQAYSNTYAAPEILKARYEEALGVEGVDGLVIATRPDCLGDEVLDVLGEMAQRTFLLLEIGAESFCNETLRRVNRGHDVASTLQAISRARARVLYIGMHLMLGLPGEGREEMLMQADVVSKLPVSTLKLHQLQIVKGTRMEEDYKRNPADFLRFSAESYADLMLDYVEHLRSDIAIERFTNQSPPAMLAEKGWSMKNHEFLHLMEQRALLRGGVRQGARQAL